MAADVGAGVAAVRVVRLLVVPVLDAVGCREISGGEIEVLTNGRVGRVCPGGMTVAEVAAVSPGLSHVR